MGTLFSALNSARTALDAFQQAINVSQNNVTNANTPGYAKQVAQMNALPFNLSDGLTGGVQEQTQNTRNQYAETAVQDQQSLLGLYTQLQTSLGPLQNVFDVSSTSAIPTALNNLFSAFSSWATTPGGPNQQAAVINAAQQVSAAFQTASAQLSQIQASNNQDLQSTVTQINQDAAQIQSYNESVAPGDTPDAGLSAQLYNTLDNLASLANIQVLQGNGGTVTVLLGGQTPLVIGNQVDPLQAQFSSSPTANPVSIVDSNGVDVTSQVTGGSLAGLLSVANSTLPSLAGSNSQQGGLNTLAQNLANTVNSLLAQGATSSTTSPPGAPLFTYDATSPSGIAATLAVNPSLTPDQLAAANPGPPASANGIALQLAGLDNAPGGQINGLGYTQYFASLTAQVGNAVSSANTAVTSQTQVVAQAQSARQQLSGVSLDEEAVQLVQLQRSYQAASKVVNVVDQLMQSILNMVQ